MSDFIKNLTQRNKEATPMQIEDIANHVDRLAVVHHSDNVPWLVKPGEYAVGSSDRGYYQTGNLTTFSTFRHHRETGPPEDPNITDSWSVDINLPPEKQRVAGGLAVGRCIELRIQRVTESRAHYEQRNDVQKGLEAMKKIGLEPPPVPGTVAGALSSVALDNPGIHHMRMRTELAVYDADGYLDQSTDASAYLREAASAHEAGDEEGAMWAFRRGVDAIAEPPLIAAARESRVTRAQARRFGRMLSKLNPQNVLDKSPLVRG